MTMEGFDIKIRLDKCRPLTWRDLIVPENITFEEMHLIIQEIFGFYNEHLYEFNINHLNIHDSKFEDIDGLFVLDSMTTRIKEYFSEYKKIHYQYDFGDGWTFTIEVKKKVFYDEVYPTIKRFKGKYNPIEDIGGVYVLMDLISYENGECDELPEYMDEIELDEFNQDFSQDNLKTLFKERYGEKKISDKDGLDLYVIFNELEPLTCRNIQVPLNISFSQLHDIIQIVTGFDNYHNYQFIDLEENLYISDDPDSVRRASQLTVGQYFRNKEYILYEYDFGDSWVMTIQLNKHIEIEKSYAKLVDYRGKYNPIDDCGGPLNFMELLEIKEECFDEDDYNEEDIEDIKSIKKINVDKINKKLSEL